MKKVITTDISQTVGMPVKSGTLIHLQESFQNQFIGMTQGLISNYNSSLINIIFGVQNTGSGSSYIISAGWVSYNDELFEVDAANFTAAVGAVAVLDTTYFTATNADPVKFTDGNNYNVHAIRKILIVDGDSATAGYIDDFANLLQPIYKANTPTWFEVGQGGNPAFQNSWVNYDEPNFGRLRYSKDARGVVTITGAIKDGSISTANPVFTLPVGYRPLTRYAMVVVGSNTATGGDGFSTIIVFPNGDVTIRSNPSASWDLDSSFVALQVSFPTN